MEEGGGATKGAGGEGKLEVWFWVEKVNTRYASWCVCKYSIRHDYIYHLPNTGDRMEYLAQPLA